MGAAFAAKSQQHELDVVQPTARPAEFVADDPDAAGYVIDVAGLATEG